MGPGTGHRSPGSSRGMALCCQRLATHPWPAALGGGAPAPAPAPRVPRGLASFCPHPGLPGHCWVLSGCCWGLLGCSWGAAGSCCGASGVVLGAAGVVLGAVGVVLGAAGVLLGCCWGLPMPSPASLLPTAEAVQGRKPEHRVRVRDAGAGAGTGEDPGQHQLGEGEHGDGAGLVPARGRFQLTLRPRSLRTLLPARPRGRLAPDGLRGLSPKLPEPPAPWPGQTLTHSSALLTPSSPAPSPKCSLLEAPVPPWASPAGSLAAPEGQGPLPPGRAWRLYDGQWGGGRGALGWWGGLLPSSAWDDAGLVQGPGV